MGMTSKQGLAALALILASASAWAAPIYLCVDASGHKELTDLAKPGCKALDVPGAAVSVPMPSHRGDGARKVSAPATSPADFPRVDVSQQRARDDDRRAILQDELRAEEQKLIQLRAEFNNGEPERQGNEKNYAKYQERVAQMRDNISRSEKNVEALKRELSNIR